MGLTVDEMKEMLDNLVRARSSGVLVVKHGDTTTTYRSVSELNAAIAALKEDIARASGKRRRRVHYITQRSKGYGC